MTDRLFDLLPHVHQRADEAAGGPLRALLSVITEQADLLEADLWQLYENWFVETGQEWVLPYLGDLVGYRLHPASPTAAVAPRRDIGHTVGNRRRKGTLALLEQLAQDVAEWPARAVEFRRLLVVTPAVRCYGRDPRADARRLHRGNLADIHSADVMERLDGPFDQLAHTVDVRRINSARTPGNYNIGEVGLYVWRLRCYSVTRSPAYCDDRSRAHFTFSILGNDAPLIAAAEPEPSPTHIAGELNVPAFIRRRGFAANPAAYYGPGKSLCVYRGTDEPVGLDEIVTADLTGWRYVPAPGQVAIDPALGRIAFPPRHAPDDGVWVSYHYGFAAQLGGGEYHRAIEPRVASYRVGAGQRYETIMAAVEQWRQDKAADPAAATAVIELTDSGTYQEQIEITLTHGDRLTVRAAQRTRPVIRLLDWYSNKPDALRVVGPEAGEGKPPVIAFEGLLITGRSVRVRGEVGAVVLRHSTLVPGWSLTSNCNPEHEEEASVELIDTSACLQVQHSILGTILVDVDETYRGPLRIIVSDSIIDAAGACLAAITAPGDRHAHATLDARRVTVFGAVRTHAVGLIEGAILTGELCVARRQQGCLRFSWISPDSQTPAQFHCEPAHSAAPDRVIPRFTSTRYGEPGYGQLAVCCPDEIRRGAEDGSEMGALHDLFQPQRADNLHDRLDEYTPAVTDAGILIAT